MAAIEKELNKITKTHQPQRDLTSFYSRLRNLRDEYEGLQGQCNREMLQQLELESVNSVRGATFAKIGSIIAEASQKSQEIDCLPYFENLNLSMEEKEKLTLCFSEYNQVVLTALEVDPTVEIKPVEEVLTAFLSLTPEQIKAVAKFTKPTLIISSKNSFENKITNINKNKKYQDSRGGQSNAEFSVVSDNLYYRKKSFYTPTKTIISVVDGQPDLPRLPEVGRKASLQDMLLAFTERFKGLGIRLTNIHEAMFLEQHSLRESERNGNDISKIVDYKETRTIVSLEDKNVETSTNIIYSYFDTISRRLSFQILRPSDSHDKLRLRASLPFLKY